MVEVTAPAGYTAPSVSFGTVDFSEYIGLTAKTIAGTGDVIPKINANIFGNDYTADSAVVSAAFKDANGKAISLGMMNFTAAESPIGLPLTGSQGIVLFLVVGAGVMAITLYVRHRRNRGDNHRMTN